MHTTDLEKLLSYHEQAVQTLRRALELFVGEKPSASARNGNGAEQTTIADARSRRRVKRRKAVTPIAVRRKHTAKVLAQYSKTDGQLPGEHTLPTPGLGRLVALGYLKRKGAGYVRTDKAYTP